MAAEVQLGAEVGYTSRANTALTGQIILGFPDVCEGCRNTIELFANAILGEKAEALQFLRTRAGLRRLTLKEGRPDADSRTRKP